ncbi:hypothetical protein ACFVZR_38690 [Streptomyces sp. NPDC058316]|uniref:hypothetical protein n=1 Tax=Streptomyces sp. NPDC058316 TaxID=3346442 RepID=UPI0036E65BD7
MSGVRCGISTTARPPTLPRRRRGRGALVGELFAHPLKDPLGDGQLVPLGPHLRQLLGQLFFKFVQFRAPRGDPFQQLGIHTPDRRWPPGTGEQEPANGQDPSDDLLRRQPPTTSVSTPRAGHTGPLTCGFKLAAAQCTTSEWRVHSIRCAPPWPGRCIVP